MAAEVCKQFLCRFYEKGSCREAERCPFSHNRQANRIPDDVCIYYLQNKCIFGVHCRYQHLSPPAASSSSPSSSSPSPSSSSSLPYTSSSSTNNNTHTTPPTSTAATTTKNLYENDQSINGVEHVSNNLVATSQDDYHHQPHYDDNIGGEQLNNYNHHQGKRNEVNNDYHYYENSNGYYDIDYNGRRQQQQQQITSETSNNKTSSENRTRSYANVVRAEEKENLASSPLCPFGIKKGSCNQPNCRYLHGILCEYCDRLCLHPFNEEQKNRHHEECVLEHEREMERSFAFKRSMDKSCGICMDIIMEKEPDSERRFGILEKCSHIFCLSCIRKWRQTKQFDSKTIRACPECRVSSDFVVPNEYWVESPDEKKQLIDEYKRNLKTKPCKYFQQGMGTCPFAGACFYLHALPDGTVQEMPQPVRRLQNQYGNTEDLRDFFLLNYLESREERELFLQFDVDDILGDMTYTDDDDDEYDFDISYM